MGSRRGLAPRRRQDSNPQPGFEMHGISFSHAVCPREQKSFIKPLLVRPELVARKQHAQHGRTSIASDSAPPAHRLRWRQSLTLHQPAVLLDPGSQLLFECVSIIAPAFTRQILEEAISTEADELAPWAAHRAPAVW
jgi:hypothetical protein